MEQKNMSVTEGREQESVSMGVLHEIKKQSLIGLATTITVALIVGALCAYQMTINYRNDQEWRELFGSYDFVTQDGDGINSANYGEQGDLNNGATSAELEK